jgi:hypothetical protein
VEVRPEVDGGARSGKKMGDCSVLERRKKKAEIWRSRKAEMGERASANPSFYGERCGTARPFVIRDNCARFPRSAFNARRMGGRAIKTARRRYGLSHPRAPVHCLGLDQQRSAPCVAQARGLLSVY